MSTSGFSTDDLFNGRIRVRQALDGYRFSIDAVLLANLAEPLPGHAVLDLGTGCGIIPLIMAYRQPASRLYGIEIQADLADLAMDNVAANGMADRIAIRTGDMASLKQDDLPEAIDMVVCNPPYQKAGAGRVNPNAQRAVARHEIRITIADVLKAARRVLRVSGRFVMIYPVERLNEVLAAMHDLDLEPKNLTSVHSYRHSNASRMVVEGVRGGRPGIGIRPPLVLYERPGKYGKAIAAMFRP